MRRLLLLSLIACAALAWSQTADELVAKNLQAKGGLEKIKAIKTLRMSAKLQQGSFVAQVSEESKAPMMLRQNVTIQGMTQIQSYDGAVGWQISPFQGRKDPELLGEDDLKGFVEEADFYGPLVDAKEKGNTIEYLGKDTVDGDDVYRLKVTLKNGDIDYYLLDPDSYLEIRVERQRFIRGSMRESVSDLGAYKQVAGVYYPYSVASGPKSNPNQRTQITVEKIEANVPIDDAQFKMPAAPPAPAPPKPGGAKPPQS